MTETVKTGDLEMQYFKFGNGPKTMVIIPGVSMKPVVLSEAAVADAYNIFDEKYTVYLFDRKLNMQQGYDTKAMADDTAMAMQALGLKDVYLFGASHGGMISLQIAIDYPDLIKKLYVASTLAKQNDVSRATFNEWIELADGNDVVALNKSINTKVYSKEYYARYADIFADLEKDGSQEEMKRFGIMAKACLDFDCFDNLNKIKCPVCVSGCWNDDALSAEGGVEIARKLGCELHIYSGYGHAIYDEVPDHKERIYNFFEA